MPVLALDAMGVLYETGDDVGGLLVPFAQGRGSPATVAVRPVSWASTVVPG